MLLVLGFSCEGLLDVCCADDQLSKGFPTESYPNTFNQGPLTDKPSLFTN
jgi:hypothetical protein